MSISVSLRNTIALSVAAVVFFIVASATASAQTTTCPAFTLSHKLGQSGGEIMAIQKFLNANGAPVASAGVGSLGMETSYFGAKTKAAVMAFQSMKGVSPVSGYWGPLTRAAANATCTTGTTPTTPTPGVGNATVSAAAQPGNSLAPQSAARVPFTKFTVTAGAEAVTMNSVTVERGGLASDSAFANVVLLDEMGKQLGIEKVLNSNHQATVGETVVIPAGTSKTFTVAANMGTSISAQSGQVAVFSVVAVNTTGTVGGTLPITGAQHTINATLSLGSVTAERGPLDPISAVTKEIGTTNYTFASYKLTAGSAEKIRVWGIRVNQSGSAAASDIANIKMTVDGQDYMPTWSADGKYAQFTFGSGIVIDKGLTKEFPVKGDVIGGSGRTISFDIYRLTDIQVTGELYGYGITPTAVSPFSSSTNPVYNAADVTINAGTFNSIAKSSAAPAANIGKQKADEILGAFTVDLKGEKVQVQSIKFDLVVDAGSTSRTITNVRLVDQNGAVIAGPVDSTTLTVQPGTNVDALTFTAATFPAGATTMFVKGQLDSNWAADDTVVVQTTPSSDWTGLTGETSGNNISVSSLSSAITANTMTVKSAALTANTLTTPSAQNIVLGTTKQHFATISLDASNSGEDVRVSNIVLMDTEGGAGSSANIDNVELWADLNSSANSDTRYGKFETRIKSAEQFSDTGATNTLTMQLDNQVTIAKNATVEVGVFADLSASAVAANTHQINVNSATAVGLTSGASITVSTSGTGQTMTAAGAGTFTVALDSSSPSTSLVAGGTTGVTVGVLKLRATNEDIDLQQMLFQLTSGTASALQGNAVKVFNGSTQVGQATFSGTAGTAYFSPNIRLPKDTDLKLTLKADLSSIGTNQAGTPGVLVKVDYDGSTLTSTKGVGVSSGSSISSSSASDTAVSGVLPFKSIPTVARIALPASNNLVNGTTDLFRFSVKADAAGDVTLYKIAVKSTATTATLTAATGKVVAYTDSGFSTAVSGFTNGELITGATITSGSDADLVFTSPITIPAGSTYYFKVLNDVAGVVATASVSTKLLGDSAPAFVGVTTAALVDADANDDFIWSGNTSGTSVAGSSDWYNGYSIVGLPSSDTDSSSNSIAN
jgi:hypothetical protein